MLLALFGTGDTMNAMNTDFETVKYITADRIKKGVEKYKIDIDRQAKPIIDKAQPDDVLELRITVNSPLRIIKAANVTQNPDKLFEVLE